MRSESIESTQTEVLPFKNAKMKVKYFPVRCDGALRAPRPGCSRGALAESLLCVRESARLSVRM